MSSKLVDTTEEKIAFKTQKYLSQLFAGNGWGDPPGLLADDLLNPIQKRGIFSINHNCNV